MENKAWKMVPITPTDEHLNSIIIRMRHDFGLLTPEQQHNLRQQARQIYEECIGEGFYQIKGQYDEHQKNQKA
jgi:hypothetical protein